MPHSTKHAQSEERCSMVLATVPPCQQCAIAHMLSLEGTLVMALAFADVRFGSLVAGHAATQQALAHMLHQA